MGATLSFALLQTSGVDKFVSGFRTVPLVNSVFFLPGILKCMRKDGSRVYLAQVAVKRKAKWAWQNIRIRRPKKRPLLKQRIFEMM